MANQEKNSRQNWKAGNMLYPVPAVMVACQRAGEKPNIITIAWAGTVCSNPPMLSISIRPERYSYDIIKETGEFTVNLVTPDLTEATDYCGVRSGRQVDKFRQMKLTAIASQKILAPGIQESPVILECKLRQIVELGSHDMFVAEVVNVSVDEKHLDKNGKFRLNQLGLVAYSHGEYFSLGKKLGKFGYSVQKKRK
ncbi:MAG: flavin reductase family protein [Eubacteriales bacterium]|nr:flavin reductase family protein [Eubacteriales bacterium]